MSSKNVSFKNNNKSTGKSTGAPVAEASVKPRGSTFHVKRTPEQQAAYAAASAAERVAKDQAVIASVDTLVANIEQVVLDNLQNILHTTIKGQPYVLRVVKALMAGHKALCEAEGVDEKIDLQAYNKAVHGVYFKDRTTGVVEYKRDVFVRNKVEFPFIALQKRLAKEHGVKLLSFTNSQYLNVIATKMDVELEEEDMEFTHGLNKLPQLEEA